MAFLIDGFRGPMDNARHQDAVTLSPQEQEEHDELHEKWGENLANHANSKREEIKNLIESINKANSAEECNKIFPSYSLRHDNDISTLFWTVNHFEWSEMNNGTHPLFEVINALTNKGFNLEQRGKSGETALLCACHKGRDRYELIKFLLSKGVNVNAQDDEGNTALHIAQRTFDSFYIVKLLLEASGIDLTVKNKAGLTALQSAEHDKIVPKEIYYAIRDKAHPEIAAAERAQRAKSETPTGCACIIL